MSQTSLVILLQLKRPSFFFYLSRYSDNSARGLVVFSDSQYGLEATRNGETNLTQDINSLFSKINKRRTLERIPVHVGVQGKERADIFAKED